VGVLAHSELCKDEDIKENFSALDPYIKDYRILNILFTSGAPRQIRLLVDKYETQLGIGRLINLLSNPDKEVRLVALGRLKGLDLNRVELLKIIIENYEKEKDPDIRKVYEDSFWVIQQRKNK